VPNIPIVRLDSGLDLPAYAKPGDAGIDLVSRIDVTIPPAGGRVLVPTGIAMAIPEGHGGFLLPRSGLALKHGVTLLNSPGLVDAGYRDEIKVLLLNTDPTMEYRVARGDRIAQLVVLPVEPVRWLEVDSFEGENRGGGFGHTGR
jgi:dUTP pyrophosphatase